MAASQYDVKDKWYPAFVDGLPSASGKTIAITGTTSGTGFAAAEAILRKGGRVLLLNRSSERADRALRKLQALASRPEDVVAVECDLQDFASVRKAAEEVKRIAGSSGIDVLVNNAGIMAQTDQPTKDGYEQQMQTNHLSHFLLTSLLISSLEAAAGARGQARVVNHSSSARKMPKTPLAEQYLLKGSSFGGDGFGARVERYHQSKLANVVFTVALQSRLSERKSGVFALVAHPGSSATSLADSMNSTFTGWAAYILRGMKRVLFSLVQSSADGAMPLLHCMLAQEVQPAALYGPSIKGVMGTMIADYVTGPPRRIEIEDLCTKPESQELLWRASEDACGRFFA